MVYYVAPKGSDTGSGSLADPWATLDRAVLAGGEVQVLAGTYAAPKRTIKVPTTFRANEPVTVCSPQRVGTWSQALSVNGETVWHATISDNAAPVSAVWDVTGRIPVWTNAAPLDTPAKWAAALLAPGNLGTRWGLYPMPLDLYFVAPPDMQVDPNQVPIWASWFNGFAINGPDVAILGQFHIVGLSTGIRLDAAAERAVVDGPQIAWCRQGVGIYAGGNAANGWQYGSDHVFRNLRITDSGHHVLEGGAEDRQRQISWYAIKSGSYNLGGVTCYKPLANSESVAFYLQGGAFNVLVEDSVFDGTFDGISHYMPDDRYTSEANKNLLVRRVTLRNHADDAIDFSRYAAGVVFEDITTHNTGTVLSPAPLWGDLTLRRFQSSRVGDQVRVADGKDAKPAGSIVKYGAIEGNHPQGHIHIEDSIFWTDTPTTQGFCPDGGDGVTVPTVDIQRSVFRAGYIVVNWGAKYQHPLEWLTFDADTTFSTPSTRPLKVQANLSVPLTEAAVVDARYNDPARGDFRENPTVLHQQLDTAHERIAQLEAIINSARQQLDAATG